MQNKNYIILAGGCFWGVEELLRKEDGIIETEVGYSGGLAPNPDYELVKKGESGHAESVKVTYDPSKTSLSKILDFFFKIHDPTTKNRQGNDVGTQYRSAIFYRNDEQKKAAHEAIARVEKSGRFKGTITTSLEKESLFYSAENQHQDYLQKNPGGYTCHYIRD